MHPIITTRIHDLDVRANRTLTTRTSHSASTCYHPRNHLFIYGFFFFIHPFWVLFWRRFHLLSLTQARTMLSKCRLITHFSIAIPLHVATILSLLINKDLRILSDFPCILGCAVFPLRLFFFLPVCTMIEIECRSKKMFVPFDPRSIADSFQRRPL